MEIAYVSQSPVIPVSEIGNITGKKSADTNRKILDGIRKQIIAGRYPAESISELSHQIKTVNYFVLLDYLHYGARLADRLACKHVEPYDPGKWARQIYYKALAIPLKEKG